MAIPDLLNEDGTASIATVLLMSHHGLRRDLARLAAALQKMPHGSGPTPDDLRDEWRSYREKLHGHHEGEDTKLFPHLRSQHARLDAIIDSLMADHRRIDPLLERGDRAFAELPVTTAATAVVAELTALLDAHLADEEAQAVPFLRDAKEFPPPSSDAETEMYAEGFAWSSHGIAPDVLAAVNVILPEALRSRLPSARAAFAARYQRIWGVTDPGASRKAAPDL